MPHLLLSDSLFDQSDRFKTGSTGSLNPHKRGFPAGGMVARARDPHTATLRELPTLFAERRLRSVEIF